MMSPRVVFAPQLENDDLVQEVEALSGEFDNTGARETELLDKLKAKEQQLSALATDGVRQSQLLSRVKDRADAAQALVQAKGAKLAAMQQVVDAQSAQLAALRDKFEDASAIVSRAQYREAAATQQLANASARVKEAQSAMSDALKRAGTAVTESVTHREAKEAAEQEARRLREELEQCNRRLSKALIAAEEAEGRGDGSRRKARGSSDSKMLRMQVKEMRTLLTCTVCQVSVFKCACFCVHVCLSYACVRAPDIHFFGATGSPKGLCHHQVLPHLLQGVHRRAHSHKATKVPGVCGEVWR